LAREYMKQAGPARCHPDKTARSKGLCGACYRRSLRYAVTHDQIVEMILEQEGRCGICDEATDLVVDHNHETGEVRGMLCSNCNLLLGLLEVNSHLLTFVGNYLQRAKSRHATCHDIVGFSGQQLPYAKPLEEAQPS